MKVARVICEALDRRGIADIDILWVISWIEGDAEGMVEPSGELFDLGSFTVGSKPSQDENDAGAGVLVWKRSPLGAVRMRRGMVKVPPLSCMCSLLSARCIGLASPPA